MTASGLFGSLERIGQVQAHLPGPSAVLLALVAGAAASFLWPVTQHFATMAHEGAHATVGFVTGLKVSAMTFGLHGNGATEVSGGGPIANFSSALVGYLGPSAVGVGAAGLIRVGHMVAVLWLGAVALLIIMLSLRKRSFGYLSVPIAFVLVLGVAGFASAAVQVATAYVVAWFLLVSGLKVARIHGRNAKDAQLLQGKTKIPAAFWSFVWQLGAAGALVLGAILLV
jgi:hypothetical protein